MTPRFRDYLRAAFSARPWGMLVPPNWLALGLFGLLGAFVAPGFWLVGAGLEVGYLAWLTGNPRFRRTVRAQMAGDGREVWTARIERVVASLGERERRRYRALETRCRAVLGPETADAPADGGVGREAQAASLSQLSWMYLRLLGMRAAIEAMLRESGSGEGDVDDQLERIRARLAAEGVGDDLRRSLEAQADILEQRRRHRGEAREKLDFIDAELGRIEQQVELVREQAVVAGDPETLSRRLDDVTATLGGTAAWVREQQRVYGAMDDLLADTPPLPAGIPAGVAQGEGR